MRGQLNEIKNLLRKNPVIRNAFIALGALSAILLVVILVLILSPSKEEATKVAEIRITHDGFVPSQLSI